MLLTLGADLPERTEVSEVNPFVNVKQLEIYLTKGFAVASDHFEAEYQMHPQDVELIRTVANAWPGGRLTSWSPPTSTA